MGTRITRSTRSTESQLDIQRLHLFLEIIPTRPTWSGVPRVPCSRCSKMSSMDQSKLRAWWAHRQGLDGSLTGRSAAEVLGRTGWARSVGGVSPYLTLFSRAGLSRESVDADVGKNQICELPSARGCTYVLPASDFALGLAVGLIQHRYEDRRKAWRHGERNRQTLRRNSWSARENTARSRRFARSHRQSGTQSWPGGEKERPRNNTPRGAGEVTDHWRDSPNLDEWSTGPTTLQVHGLAAQSTARIQALEGRGIDRTRAPILFLD